MSKSTEELLLSIDDFKAGANFFMRSLFGDHIKAMEAKHERVEQYLQREIDRRDGKNQPKII